MHGFPRISHNWRKTKTTTEALSRVFHLENKIPVAQSFKLFLKALKLSLLWITKWVFPKQDTSFAHQHIQKNTGPSEKLLFWISPVEHLLQQVLKHVLLKREPYVGVQNGCIYPKWETGVSWNLLACWCLRGRSILMFFILKASEIPSKYAQRGERGALFGRA